MPETKHYVYSARTTKDGLAVLNKAKGEMNWDQFISDAVSAHYGLDRAVMAPPKREKPAKAAEGDQQPAEEAGESHLEVGAEALAEEPPKKKRGKGKGKI